MGIRVDALLVRLPEYEWTLGRHAQESLGIGYVAASLRERGFSVEIINAPLLGWSRTEALGEIRKRRAHLIGFSMPAQAGFYPLTGFIRDLRSRGGGAHITVGGIAATLAHESLLRQHAGIDSVVLGEGEETAPELMGHISLGTDWRDIPGIATMGTRKVIRNPLRPLIPNLDALSLPARDTVPLALRIDHEVPIMASRGCAARCRYCAITSFYRLCRGPVWRMRDPDRVAEEMAALRRDYGAYKFSFIDDDFLGPGRRGEEHATAIARAIRRRRLDVRFTILCRPDNTKGGVIRELKDAGLVTAFVGVESAHGPTLDWFGKRTTLAQSLAAVERFHRYGVKVEVGLMLFHPYSTLGEVAEGLAALREMDSVNITNFFDELAIYDGTPLWDELKGKGIIRRRRNEDGLYPYRILDRKAEMLRRIFFRVFSFARHSDALFPNPPARIPESVNRLHKRWSSDLLDVAEGIVTEFVRLTPAQLALRLSQMADHYARRVAQLDSAYAKLLAIQAGHSGK